MLLGFKKRFTQPILSGQKVFTMRFPRKRQAKIGERLYMYEALRTPACKLIANHFTLISIQYVTIKIQVEKKTGNKYCFIDIDGKRLQGYMVLNFVRADGFSSPIDFMDYWLDGKEHINYDLDLYHWTDLRF